MRIPPCRHPSSSTDGSAQSALSAAGHCAYKEPTTYHHSSRAICAVLRGQNHHADLLLPSGHTASQAEAIFDCHHKNHMRVLGAYLGSIAGQRHFAPLPAGLQLSRRKGCATDTGSYAKFLTNLGKWGNFRGNKNPGPGSFPLGLGGHFIFYRNNTLPTLYKLNEFLIQYDQWGIAHPLIQRLRRSREDSRRQGDLYVSGTASGLTGASGVASGLVPAFGMGVGKSLSDNDSTNWTNSSNVTG